MLTQWNICSRIHDISPEGFPSGHIKTNSSMLSTTPLTTGALTILCPHVSWFERKITKNGFINHEKMSTKVLCHICLFSFLHHHYSNGRMGKLSFQWTLQILVSHVYQVAFFFYLGWGMIYGMLPGVKIWSRYENHRICSQKSAIISPFLQIWFHIYFEKEDLITEYEIKSF